MDKLIDVSPSGGFMEMYNGTNTKAMNPVILIILSLTILFYFIIFSYLGNGVQPQEAVSSNAGMNFIEMIMWGLFIFLVMINGLQYFFDINVKTAIKSITGTPEIDIQMDSQGKDELQMDDIDGINMNMGNPIKGLGNLIGDNAKNMLGAGGKFISDGVKFTTNSAGKLMDGKGNIVNEAGDIVTDGLNKLSENTSGVLNSVSGITNNRSAQQQQQSAQQPAQQQSAQQQQAQQQQAQQQQQQQQQQQPAQQSAQQQQQQSAQQPQQRRNNNASNMQGNNLGSLPLLTGRDVFHVPTNDYTYTEAQAVCKAFGGELASYEDLERAYNTGGEWCSYGWSKDQMALFPTQISTWKKLQTIDGHKNDCGRPGINGGYIENKNARYGVNCVGTRPQISEEDQAMLNSVSPYPKTKEDKRIDRMVDKYKQNLRSIKIAPFNRQGWNRL